MDFAIVLVVVGSVFVTLGDVLAATPGHRRRMAAQSVTWLPLAIMLAMRAYGG